MNDAAINILSHGLKRTLIILLDNVRRASKHLTLVILTGVPTVYSRRDGVE